MNDLYNLYSELEDTNILIKLNNFIKDKLIIYQSKNSKPTLQILLKNLKHSNTCYIIYTCFIKKYSEELELLKNYYEQVRDNYYFLKKKSGIEENKNTIFYGNISNKTNWDKLIIENKKLYKISEDINIKIEIINKQIYSEEWIDILNDHIYIKKINKKLINLIIEFNLIIKYNIELQNINKTIYQFFNNINILCSDKNPNNNRYIYFNDSFKGKNLDILYMICSKFSNFLKNNFNFDDTQLTDVIEYIEILKELLI